MRSWKSCSKLFLGAVLDSTAKTAVLRTVVDGEACAIWISKRGPNPGNGQAGIHWSKPLSIAPIRVYGLLSFRLPLTSTDHLQRVIFICLLNSIIRTSLPISRKRVPQ
ncbi:hypothetical protein BDY21DRAFT_338374 [Lineolata rhizophorae]|uniref:Uncharacterized protein n=1 Tax=Lineolata rhizophorae TaxID=578093 RepID=A0A6A6P658_9PEZI|nr:hypothetical protein BDY21DRAFT_338374 [Lineolata rhizophorae]